MTEDYRFCVSGKKFRLGAAGLRTLRVLCELGDKSLTTNDVSWLLPLRPRIREIERANARAALCLAISHTNQERLRLLAIWLRGRCGGSLGTSIVAAYATSPDRMFRKEVARCLKRMSGWSELRLMEASELDPQIRRLATQASPATYKSRLSQFCQNVRLSGTSPTESQLYVSAAVDNRQGRPPRPAWLIRLFLERIHRLVNRTTSLG